MGKFPIDTFADIVNDRLKRSPEATTTLVLYAFMLSASQVRVQALLFLYAYPLLLSLSLSLISLIISLIFYSFTLPNPIAERLDRICGKGYFKYRQQERASLILATVHFQGLAPVGCVCPDK